MEPIFSILLKKLSSTNFLINDEIQVLFPCFCHFFFSFFSPSKCVPKERKIRSLTLSVSLSPRPLQRMKVCPVSDCFFLFSLLSLHPSIHTQYFFFFLHHLWREGSPEHEMKREKSSKPRVERKKERRGDARILYQDFELRRRRRE